jgi:hypothetical protein
MLHGVLERQDAGPLGPFNLAQNIGGHPNGGRPLHTEVQHLIPAGALEMKTWPDQRLGDNAVDEGSSARHTRISRPGPSKGSGNDAPILTQVNGGNCALTIAFPLVSGGNTPTTEPKEAA